MSWEEDEDNYDAFWSRKRYSSKRAIRKLYSGGEHVANKNEAKLLRKIMAETGLTEAEIRGHRKYRKMLSVEQDKGEMGIGNSRISREVKRLMKSITKEFKLAKEHPKVKAEFIKRWNETHYGTDKITKI